MASRTSLPAPVRRKLAVYDAALARHGLDVLDGLHLVGSAALGDYRAGLSDVDFVAVVRGDLSEGDLDRLDRVHDDLAAAGPPHLDGLYLKVEQLRDVPVPGTALPFCVEGHFRRSAPCFEANPAVWRCLARHGITVLGAPVEDIGDDPQALRSFLLDNLGGYWTRWLEEAEVSLSRKAPGETVNAAAASWGVLGVARIARTLATGEIVSKSAAGHWALGACGARWHSEIRLALAVREGRTWPLSVAATRRCLAFMRDAIGKARAPLSRSPGPPGSPSACRAAPRRSR